MQRMNKRIRCCQVINPPLNYNTNHNEEAAGSACLLHSYSMLKEEIPDGSISVASASK
jgi:hypothetical protein